MPTLRSFLDSIAPDHVPTLSMETGHHIGADSVTHNLSCSCGHTAGYRSMQLFVDEWPNAAQERVRMWVRIEMLEHLLDQEVST